MCIILTCESVRPSEKALDLSWDENPHGAGIAWIENDDVRWRKGLTLAEIKPLVATLPLPFIVHFRWASVGPISPTLTHPFPLERENVLRKKGKTSRGVLFHNGTWSEWKPHLLACAASSGVPVGDGHMSDSRAMAYLATVLGTAILSTIPGRIALLTPDGIKRFGPWVKITDGLMASNDLLTKKAKPPTISGPSTNDDDDDEEEDARRTIEQQRPLLRARLVKPDSQAARWAKAGITKAVTV